MFRSKQYYQMLSNGYQNINKLHFNKFIYNIFLKIVTSFFGFVTIGGLWPLRGSASKLFCLRQLSTNSLPYIFEAVEDIIWPASLWLAFLPPYIMKCQDNINNNNIKISFKLS